MLCNLYHVVFLCHKVEDSYYTTQKTTKPLFPGVNMLAVLRQRGNDFYGSQNYEEALRCYRRVLQSDDVSEADKAKLHNNMAACFLKLEKFEEVITHADICEFLFHHNFT